MIFYCLGIDHRRTKLEVREAASRRRNSIIHSWQSLNQAAAALFTCNRAELYGSAKDLSSMARAINTVRRDFPIIFKDAYLKQGKLRVIRHALELASGLHSQILGERQIYQQLSSWLRRGQVSEPIKNIWVKVLRSAANIRDKSGIGSKGVNIADIVLADLGSSQPKQVVVIGTGKVAELIADKRVPGVSLHFVSRKRESKAKQLARACGGRAIKFDNLFDTLTYADALISATASPHYILGKEKLLRVISKRSKPLYIYDLALPRDIEPEAGDIPGVSLQNLDDLRILFKKHNSGLRECIQKAEDLIEEKLYEVSDQSRDQAKSFSLEAGRRD